jgi:organic hydroperoxide reductase OsmC/OhrA
MEPFPHRYRIRAEAGTEGVVRHPHDRLPELRANAPVEFDGPGDEWSPEELLTAAVADCFVLSFRAVAAASSLPWDALTCDVEGTLERVDRVNCFTRFVLCVHLVVSDGVDHDRAERLLHKAESICLVTNSMTAERVLEVAVSTG